MHVVNLYIANVSSFCGAERFDALHNHFTVIVPSHVSCSTVSAIRNATPAAIRAFLKRRSLQSLCACLAGSCVRFPNSFPQHITLGQNITGFASFPQSTPKSIRYHHKSSANRTFISTKLQLAQVTYAKENNHTRKTRWAPSTTET